MMSLYLSLKKGGWIYVSIRGDTTDEFYYIQDKIKVIPVLSYEKKLKTNITSIHYLDELYEICRVNNIEVCLTENLEAYHQRYKLRLKTIKNARTNTEFKSEYWTDDPSLKILSYQAQCINTAIAARRLLIGDDMGLGKTAELTGIICKALEQDYSRALIVVLNRLKYQWRDEILKFTKFKPEDISVIDPYKKFECPLKITDKLDLRSVTSPCRTCERVDTCKKERNDPNIKWRRQLKEGKIVIVNYEALDKMKDAILLSGFDIFGLDEASKLKNNSTKMSKAAVKIGSSLPSHAIIVPMSGTFIENRVEEIYPALTVIDKKLLGEWYNFRNRYLILDHWNNVIGYRNGKRLKGIIDKWIVRRTIDEVWKDRPPLTESNKLCEMEPKQRQIYDDAKAGCLDELKDKEVQSKINIADIGPLLNYLIQLCDTTETMDPKIKQSIKIEILKDLIVNEISRNHKIVLFSFFGNKVVPILERELTALKLGKCLTITGKTKLAQAEKNKKLFMENDKYRYLVCSDALGYGANLQVARYVINFDLPWNPAKLNQRIARVYRKGQTKSVTVYNLVCTNTIEDNILEKIGDKRKIFEQFLGGGIKKSKLSLSELIGLLKQ